MATLESPVQAVTLPGLARTLVMTGKLEQQAAEDIYKRAQQTNKNFVAELTGSGAVWSPLQSIFPIGKGCPLT